MENSNTHWLDKLYQSSIEYLVNYRKHLREYLLAIVIVLIIRSMIGVVYQIPTGSMIPTFKIGDTLLANRFYYGLKIPFTDEKPGFRLPAIKPLEVGDIAIFRGPKEEVFYHLILNLNSDDYEFLNELNQVSGFKGIINKESYDILDNNENNIIIERNENELNIRLHEDIYDEYQEKLLSLRVVDQKKDVLITSYRISKPPSFFHQLINTPLAGTSMILTIFLRSPYFYLHGKVLTYLFPEWEHRGEITLYPNQAIDTTKEYVKRVIAKGGDKVEIHNKVVYVNDQKLEWEENYETDSDNPQFLITRENFPHSPNSEEQSSPHPLRFSPSLITPHDRFDVEKWPFDVETRFSSQYRDNFGPIVVPEGHYFMMGDNRDESLDSRYIGAVPEEMISGTPMVIFLPWKRRGIVR